ncbi:DNA polymerase Y family protein [Shewanella sp. Isolate8]|uniref:Y-family DNA polymerase n=1 Tax=Shewanella sp. Isolate8 TaxID=2908529 RepID=UPI001EFEBFE5|nr:DNA polymerase Y family protein [Shewanella sp. Isolate8]MCG9746616.1 DNA polymerase Y family protein [Shewanella sp. Isolate8]
MLWLAVYFPHWLLQYQGYHQGLPQGSELALFERQSSQILIASSAAAKLGVETGQSLATAQALSPSLQLLAYEPSLSQEAIHWLCQWSYGYSARVVPPVCPFEQARQKKPNESPSLTDTLLLEVGSMAKVFGGLDRLISQYHKTAQDYGLECQFALGENALLAQLGARYRPMFRQAGEPSDDYWPLSQKNEPLSQENAPLSQENTRLLRDNEPQGMSVAPAYPQGAEIEEVAPEVLAQQAYGQERLSQEELSQERLSQEEFVQVTLAQIASLPVSVLPLPQHVLQALENMGLTQVKALLTLPFKELGERFGETVLTLLARLKGQLPQVHEFYQMPESYRHKLALLYEVSHLEGLAFPLGRMLGTLSAYLVQRQQAVLALSLTLVFRDLNLAPLRCEIRYPFAEHRADALLKLCRVQLERLTLEAPVTSLAIQADTLVALSVQTPHWWKGEGESDASMRLLSLLEARLGADKVKGLENHSHHLPEQSWQSRSLSQNRLGAQGRKGASQDAMVSGSNLCAEPRASYQGKTRALSEEATLFTDLFHGLCDGRIRPNWLLRQPEPIGQESVSLLKGPERLHSPWSASPPRDYYLARRHHGGLCWVFRTPEGLFLQGWFG